jgi:mannonate dehydratase
MNLGLSLNKARMSTDDIRYAKQAGVTHLHIGLAQPQPSTDRTRASRERYPKIAHSDPDDADWSIETMRDMRKTIEDHGLVFEVVTGIEPAHWYDVLLDGPRRDEQMEMLKKILRNMGRAGIPILGYNFTIAGVWGRKTTTASRGGATSPGFHDPPQPPIPDGMVWNRIYDPDLYDEENPKGYAGQISHEEFWQRFEAFLAEILPVAEESGVTLALHPDDPPMPTLRGTPRLIYGPDHYQRMLDISPSPSNGMNPCVGTMAEMAEGDIYDMVDRYSRTGRVAFVHFRNVRGKVPHYDEVFIDEGDVDMIRVLRILKKNGFDGTITPDHSPNFSGQTNWHTARAFTLGWLNAAIGIVEREG